VYAKGGETVSHAVERVGRGVSPSIPMVRGEAESYFFGKFGSAFTSAICLVCRSLWAAVKSIHS